MTALTVLGIWVLLVVVMAGLLFGFAYVYKRMKKFEEIPERKTQAPTSSKLVCELAIKLKTGDRQLSWTADKWESYKKFHLWYFGRPNSKQYVMECNGPNNKPMRQLLLREEIIYFQTSWILDPKPKPPKGPDNIPA